MGMTIDTAITVLGMVEAHGICIEAKDIAVETMHKYQQLQADYENRLRADMVAMLTDIQLEIEELKNEPACCHHFVRGIRRSSEVIQQKIDALKEQTDVREKLE